MINNFKLGHVDGNMKHQIVDADIFCGMLCGWVPIFLERRLELI